MNQPEGKVFQTGKLNSPNLKIKLSNKDAIVIPWRRIAIPWHGTAILWHGITILCFNTNNASRNDKLYNLTDPTFLPDHADMSSCKMTKLYG